MLYFGCSEWGFHSLVGNVGDRQNRHQNSFSSYEVQKRIKNRIRKTVYILGKQTSEERPKWISKGCLAWDEGW